MSKDDTISQKSNVPFIALSPLAKDLLYITGSGIVLPGVMSYAYWGLTGDPKGLSTPARVLWSSLGLGLGAGIRYSQDDGMAFLK